MAYRKGHRFNGMNVNTPGVYSMVESNMQNFKTNGAKNIAIIGESKGGVPHEIMFIDDAEIAKEIVKGGELLKAMLKAYDPVTQTKIGVSLGGADLIMAIRTNEATKATSDVKEVGSEEVAFTVESKDYGEDNNLISYKIEEGTDVKTKRLTIHEAKKDRYEVFDNIGGAFSVRYTGEQPYATLSIESADNKSVRLVTKIGEDELSAINDLEVELNPTQFRTVKALATYIAGFENYEVVPSTVINSNLTVEDLDALEDVDIKAAAMPITAVVKDLVYTTLHQSRYVNILADNPNVKFANNEFTPLANGEEGQSPTSWISFLDQLARYDIDYIIPLTDDLSILAECREHCIEMSERKRKERRLVAGAGVGLSALQAIQNGSKLAHPRVQYMGFGAYDFDGSLLPGYIVAAAHGGRAAFLGGESATADVYNFQAPERTFEGQDRRELIDNGILFFDEVASDVNHKLFYTTLVWDYTTYTDVDDPLLVERSTGAIADQLSKELRRELDKMLTGKLTPTGVLESARNKVLSILKQNVKDELIKAYRNVSVKQIGDRTEITLEVAPTRVNNFTFLNILFYNEDTDLGTI